MNTSLERLSEPEIQRAIERAQAKAPGVSVTERGVRFVRAAVACNGSCGEHLFNGGEHDVVIWHDKRLTCSCPTVKGMCLHVAALLAHEGGALPDAPATCESRGCGTSPLFYEWGGNGHAPACPLFTNGPRYERPQTETAKRIAAGAVKREPVPLGEGRQKLVDKTRPTIHVSEDSIVIYRSCGHTAYVNQKPWEYIAADAIPLSPFEGCPVCNDHMQPPAPDQVRAQEEK